MRNKVEKIIYLNWVIKRFCVGFFLVVFCGYIIDISSRVFRIFYLMFLADIFFFYDEGS